MVMDSSLIKNRRIEPTRGPRDKLISSVDELTVNLSALCSEKHHFEPPREASAKDAVTSPHEAAARDVIH